jgi:GT2 family glycosyltransferase
MAPADADKGSQGAVPGLKLDEPSHVRSATRMEQSSFAQADVDAPSAPPEVAEPLVTVVLPVLNGAGRLEHALTALSRQDFPKASFEVIIADGRSRDSTVEIARSFGCRVVDNPGITVAAGRNVGVQHARGELIAFSEDDIILPPHWLSSAVRLLTESGAVGVGGPTPIPPRSSVWSHAVNAVFRLASRGGASVQSDRVSAGAVDDLPGGNSLYSARALRAVGPIDERLTTAEDVAMHHEIRRRGWELRLCPELAAEHHKRDSVLGFFRQMQRFAIGRVQLWRRWPGALSMLHWLAGAIGVAGPVLAAVLCINGIVSGMMLVGLAALAAALTSMLVALRQGEQLRVALLFPVTLAVFIAGWSSGLWSELLIPSRDAKRIHIASKLRDLLERPIEATRPLSWLLGTFIALECSLLAVFSQRAPFIMDEFQQGGYARHIDSGYYSSVVPFKTVLFTYLYYLPRLWIHHARDLLLFQRAETLVLVFATLCVSYATSRALGRSRTEGGIVVALTLAFATFFEHACSLRAEPSALLLSSVGLYAVVLASSRRRGGGWHSLVAGIALGGGFFCTQKAVWFCASFGLAGVLGTCVAVPSQSQERTPARRVAAEVLTRSLTLAGGFLLVAAVYCVSFAPATPEQVFRGVFLRSSQFALAGSNGYGDLGRFVLQVFERSWWLFVICGLGFVFAAARVLREARLMVCWVGTLAMGAFVLAWKEPWPYTFTWWIPFLASFGPDALRATSHRISIRSPGAARAVSFLVLLTALGSTLPRTFEAMGWSNQVQLAMVERVESLLGPGEFYQDGIGMVSTRPLSGLVWWDVPAIQRIRDETRRGQNTEMARAFRDPPKVLVMNYRLQNLEPALRPFIEGSYIPVEGGLLVAGAEVRSGKPGVEVRWEGRYGLVDRDGRRAARDWSLDGVKGTGARLIASGAHQIETPDCIGCFIIPDDVVDRVVPASVVTPVPLFERPYTR